LREIKTLPSRKYLIEQAALLLTFARATTDPYIAAGLLDKATALSRESEKARDTSLKAPDVERPQG
jgi:hypothetical protein